MAAYTGGFMAHVTCRLAAKNRDQLRNPTLGNRVWATFLPELVAASLVWSLSSLLCSVSVKYYCREKSTTIPTKSQIMLKHWPIYDRATALQVSNFLLRLDVTLHKMLYLR